MSPPERFPPDDLREWLNRAGSNLAMAKNRAPGAYLENLCFQAQQAAEKAVKEAYQDAIEIAEAVTRWARARVTRRPG